MTRSKIIAELSCNHNGDMDLARQMIVSAKANGADYVKFQAWKESQLKPGPWDSDGRRDIYKNAELSIEQLFDLSVFCNECGIKFLTSCFVDDYLGSIRDFSNEIKIPSPECTNRDFVLSAINKFDVVYVSIGASTFKEIEYLFSYDNVFVMHCVSVYPCPAKKINLTKMLSIASRTKNYGYSGHLFGIEDAVAALALGAKVIEKHFTTNRNLDYRDNHFAILPDDLKQIRHYADMMSEMFENLGDNYQNAEEEVRTMYKGRWSKKEVH